MNTKTQKTIEWVLSSATALALIGVGLNIAAMQTLGYFSAASVILALSVGFWAFVLGSMAFLLSSMWLVINRKAVFAPPTRQRSMMGCSP